MIQTNNSAKLAESVLLEYDLIKHIRTRTGKNLSVVQFVKCFYDFIIFNLSISGNDFLLKTDFILSLSLIFFGVLVKNICSLY